MVSLNTSEEYDCLEVKQSPIIALIAIISGWHANEVKGSILLCIDPLASFVCLSKQRNNWQRAQLQQQLCKSSGSNPPDSVNCSINRTLKRFTILTSVDYGNNLRALIHTTVTIDQTSGGSPLIWRPHVPRETGRVWPRYTWINVS